MASFGDLNRVNTNVQSLDSQLSLNRVNRDLADSRMRMSTGLKINKAEDNAAGYSIATKLKSRTAGLEQALQNVGDAKSVLDIAESSFDTIMDSLVEMKGLATQAANDTLGDTERGYIGDQIKALGDDINEIANQTVFQDFDLLNGATDDMSGSLDLTFQVGERASDTISTSIDAVNVGELFASSGDASLGATTTAGGGAAAGGAISATAATTSGQGALTFAATATADDFRSFLSSVDGAIDEMSNRVSDIGITQSSLSVREETLSESISANESAKSRIMDTDFAKEQSKSVKLQILQQTATSSLAQANMGPQSVLGFLG
ncbi:flagellin [Gracilimonas sp. BCB1]|uniref:flagellin n=1 Tax=Gracilimonas sp. BCB1 TaxID=3152362 RepID=UPI0032D984B0